MAIMLGALYDALVEGQTSKEAARKAAEEVAAYESRLATIESRVTLLIWMVGVLTTLALINLGFTFQILTRLPPR
jgi:hypothetical protein